MACYLCLSRKIPFKAKIWCCLLFMQPYFYQQLLSARLETFDKLSTFCSTELKFCCHEGLQIFFIIWVYHVTWFTRVLFFFLQNNWKKISDYYSGSSFKYHWLTYETSYSHLCPLPSCPSRALELPRDSPGGK